MPDIEAITNTASDLVRIPSRAQEDPIEPILLYASDWLVKLGLKPMRLFGPDGLPVGLSASHRFGPDGPLVCLNACLDTAPFGDPGLWSRSPTSGVVLDGKLLGRGSADSKISAAIFGYLVAGLIAAKSAQGGELALVLDADEHSGAFGGVRAFLSAAHQRPDVWLIGYPGNNKIVVGARGFLRSIVHVQGVARHTGDANHDRLANAVGSAAEIITAIQSAYLPELPDNEFGLPPTINVTAVAGGVGFSQIADRCTFNVDIRLTPQFDESRARRFLEDIIARFVMTREQKSITVDWKESWPAYRLSNDHVLVRVFVKHASAVLGRTIPARTCGPSNVGNYLSTLGIPTICGFGVSYKNIHGTDEHAELSSVATVFEVYRRVVTEYLTMDF